MGTLMQWFFYVFVGVLVFLSMLVLVDRRLVKQRSVLPELWSREWWDGECSRFYRESEDSTLSENERMFAFRNWQDAERHRQWAGFREEFSQRTLREKVKAWWEAQ